MHENQLKQTLLETIQEVGHFIKKQSTLTFDISDKEGKNNIVTEVDLKAEEMIKASILKKYPNHGFLGEEYGSENPKSSHQWIIDPIDGTINFAHQIPLYCVSIALAVEGTLTLGAIYNPVTEELFFAEKGKGAWLNQQQIFVSKQDNFDRSFLVTGFPYQFPEGIQVANIFAAVVNRGLPLRRLGSAALDLAYVAAGRFDGFWEYNLNPWDIAAGYLLVQEAGGRVSDFQNNEGHYAHRQTLATNGLIHESLRALILQHS